MMKYLILVFLLGITQACEAKPKRMKIGTPVCLVEITDNEINKLLLRYWREYSDELSDGGVLTFRYDREDGEIVYYLSYILNASGLQKTPSYYSKVDGHYVLIYTGIEDKIRFDSTSVAAFQATVEPSLYNDAKSKTGNELILPPITYNPAIWRIKFLKGVNEWDIEVVDRLPY